MPQSVFSSRFPKGGAWASCFASSPGLWRAPKLIIPLENKGRGAWGARQRNGQVQTPRATLWYFDLMLLRHYVHLAFLSWRSLGYPRSHLWERN